MNSRVPALPKRRAPSATSGISGSSLFGRAALLCSGLLAGIAIGSRWSSNGAHAASLPSDTDDRPTQVEPGVAKTPASRNKKIQRPFLIRPADLFVAQDAERDAEYREHQAADLKGLLLSQIDLLEMGLPGQLPELHANGMAMYQQGVIDAVTRTAPELVDELSAEIERTLCDPNAKQSHQIAMARFVSWMPETASESAFDCVFKRGQEDIVTWSALDAWRNADVPKSAALLELERKSSDERTLRRLADNPARDDDPAGASSTQDVGAAQQASTESERPLAVGELPEG